MKKALPYFPDNFKYWFLRLSCFRRLLTKFDIEQTLAETDNFETSKNIQNMVILIFNPAIYISYEDSITTRISNQLTDIIFATEQFF